MMSETVLNAAEPVEAAVLPEAARIVVGHLDGGDPFGVLEPELGGGAQPQRKSERIAEIFLGIFGRQDGLRMQRGGHVDAAVIVVEAAEGDVFGGQVGADGFEEVAQIYAR